MSSEQKSAAVWAALSRAVTVLGILGVLAAGFFFLAPLKSIPKQIDTVEENVHGMKTQVAVQGQTIKALTQATQQIASLLEKTEETRETVGRHGVEIVNIKERLRRLEHYP